MHNFISIKIVIDSSFRYSQILSYNTALVNQKFWETMYQLIECLLDKRMKNVAKMQLMWCTTKIDYLRCFKMYSIV